jgi:hypothetical protein
MDLMHEQFDSMTQGERMELRVRRMIGQDPVPVRICVGRRNGKTEFLRRYVGRFDQEEREVVDLAAEEDSHWMQKRIEQIATEYLDQATFQAPTAITAEDIARAVEALRRPLFDKRHMRELSRSAQNRFLLAPPGTINHNAVFAADPAAESMYKDEARPGIVVTSHGPFVKEYRMATETMPAHEAIEIRQVMTEEEIREMLAQYGALDADDGVAGDS